MKILVLGGYGSTGKLICDLILKTTAFEIVVAGPSLEKANTLKVTLQAKYGEDRVQSAQVDAKNKKKLITAFSECQLVIVAASTAKYAKRIAEAAIEARVDYIDIYFHQSTFEDLLPLKEKIAEKELCFITQAGFHPGLPAVYMRKGYNYFDEYKKSIIAFTMKFHVESIPSVEEIITSLGEHDYRFYKDGFWWKGSYRDYKKVDFGSDFGEKVSIPMYLKEIENLPSDLGLEEAGIYTTGFNWFTDWIVFPLATLTQKMHLHALDHFWAKSLAFGINKFTSGKEGVVFMLIAEGVSRGKKKNLIIRSSYDNAYGFTAIPVVALIKQLTEGTIRKKGLWMMGNIAEPQDLIDRMVQLGVSTTVSLRDVARVR
jgi:saccharopine dehydrogenase (NAD+, L-lysine-forming)